MSSDPSFLRVFSRGAPASRAGRAVSGTWDQDEAAAFVETLFAKHHGEIHVYLLRMVRDPELAADLTQDAFVKAYRNYDTLEKPENARAWLYQIAHRVALDEIRRRSSSSAVRPAMRYSQARARDRSWSVSKAR